MRHLRHLLLAGCAFAIAACAPVAPPRRPSDPAATVVVRDVSVVDVVSGTVKPHRTVTIVADKIRSVESSHDARVPSGATVLEGRGRFLIPGLWDMHSHSLWNLEAMQAALPVYVANGVTGIRDMGGQLPVLTAYRERMEQGRPAWPRVVAAGVILDGPSPVQPDVSLAVADRAGAIEAVRTLADAGVDFIKVYTLLPRDAYFAALEEAQRLGLPVVGHVPADVTVEEATETGQRSIEHLREEIEPFCRPSDVEACRELAADFRAHRTWQVPTLVVLRAKARFDDPGLDDDPRLESVPPFLREEWSAARQAKIERGDAYLRSRRDLYADELWLTGFLATEEVPLLAGTDAGNPYCYPGFSLHDELGLLVEAGLTPWNALRAATVGPAEFLGTRDTTGSIEPGKAADLVLLNGNPLLDIAATRDIEAVVLRGRVLERADLDAVLRDARPPVRTAETVRRPRR